MVYINYEYDKFKNKICIVTGSNGNIGKSICNKLRQSGALVIETDIKKS